MTVLSAQILSLLPLSMAAGLDLYLTLAILGIGQAGGWWDPAPPGALADLAALPVLFVAVTLYCIEFLAERLPWTSLVWNAFHAAIRPISGALLALLLLNGQPGAIVLLGGLAGGIVAGLVHGMRCGATVLSRVGPRRYASPLLISLAEDVVTFGLVALTLDAPLWATMVAAVALAASVRWMSSLLRAFAYTVRIAAGGMARPDVRGRWMGPDEFPPWLRTALGGVDQDAGGALQRGTAVGAGNVPGLPPFVVGWLVVHSGTPSLVVKRGPLSTEVPLDGFGRPRPADPPLFRRFDLASEGRQMFLLSGPDGPGTDSVISAFPGP
jgi:hypothetical protein